MQKQISPQFSSAALTESMHGLERAPIGIEDVRDLGLSYELIPDVLLDQTIGEIRDDLERTDKEENPDIFYQTYLEYGPGVLNGLNYLYRTADLITLAAQDHLGREDEVQAKVEANPIRQHLLEVFLRDKSHHKGALIAHNAPFTLRDIAAFIDTYYEDLDANGHMDAARERLDTAKDTFLSDLDGDVAAELIPDKAIRDQIAQTAKASPVKLMDPLTWMLTDLSNTEDTWGGFYYEDRTARVLYPLDIDPEDPLFTDQLRHHLYHELLHSAFLKTFTRQFLKDPSAEGELKRKFPSFLEEAVVEKIAFVVSSQHSSTSERNPKSGASEEDWRYDVDAPDHVLMSKDSPHRASYDEALESRDQVYDYYRLAVDIIFDRIDWSKAGVTKKQAEGMFALACFETPLGEMPRQEDRHPLRKSFFATLRKAGGAGLINRVDQAIESIGLFRALSLLQNPDVDITSIEEFPATVSAEKYAESVQRVNNIVNTKFGAIENNGEDAEVGELEEAEAKARVVSERYRQRIDHTQNIIDRQDVTLGVRNYVRGPARPDQPRGSVPPRPFVQQRRRGILGDS